MDPFIAVNRLPQLAQAAMRNAVLAGLARGRITPRMLADDALIRFERAVGREAPEGIRPALLFAERDRVVRELRAFIDSRLAARLVSLKRRDIVALARGAAPYDAIVRNRHGRCYGIVLRRLPSDGRRLETLRRMHSFPGNPKRTPLSGILVFDFTSAVVRVLLNDAGANGVDRHLRAC